tara:strand:+ start:58 stop:261 length:204 start_codon:yes stop_codon:yes gene_type:complete
MKMSDSVAEFLARGGKITKVSEGERSTSDRELYKMSKDELFSDAEKRTGGSLSDATMLSIVEHKGCE